MAAELVSRTLDESIDSGFVRYELTDTYQVTTSGRSVGVFAVLSTNGLPLIGSAVEIDGTVLQCRRRKPVQPEPKGAATFWVVEVVYSNDASDYQRNIQGEPITNPTEAVKQVDLNYVESSEPVTDAVLLGATINGPTWDPSSSPIQLPPWLPVGKVGPPTNSAGQPILLERPTYQEVVSVSRVVRNWENSWSNYLDAINSDEITITESDQDGVRFSKTYAPFTLRMDAVEKENIWRDNRLYYRVTFTMSFNRRTWLHSELDKGTERRVFIGQSRPEGGEYDQDDLDRLEIASVGYESITSNEGTVAIGEPIKFNGTGAEMPLARLDSQSYDDASEVHLNYRINPEILPFADLNL